MHRDLPEDPTGRFDDFEDFVESNFNTCKWIGLLIFLVQVCQTNLKVSNMTCFRNERTFEFPFQKILSCKMNQVTIRVI